MVGLVRLIAAVVVTVAAAATATLQCKDDDGRSVDWWVAVKEPRGTGYFYGDSNSGGAFTRSRHSMNDTAAGALAATMRQVWDSDAAVAYILWNDEPPAATGYNFSYGHTKAVLVGSGSDSGFWLTHSIPLFPAGPALIPEYSGLGSNAWMYAQSAACFTLDSADAVNTVASSLQLVHPQIYDTGGDAAAVGPEFAALAAGTWSGDAVCKQTTVGALTVFAKTPAWNADLWSACIAPALQRDLWVESWLRGSEEGPACSGAWKTLDVQSLAWGWDEPADHSKWAVAQNTTLCIGDINRMTTQYARAGGAVCFDTPLAATFAAAVTATNEC